ncbi:hypothetical protein PSHT_06042, partial [Puccinia striiformis]
IFDSIIILSQFGPSNLEHTDNKRLTSTFSSPDFSSPVDLTLILLPRSTGPVTCDLTGRAGH